MRASLGELMSNFAFLAAEFPTVHEAAAAAGG